MTAPAQTPAPTPPTLEDYVRAGFMFSNHLWVWALWLDLIAAVGSILGLILPLLSTSRMFVLLSLVPFVLAFFIRVKQQKVHDLAERTRRANLLAAGLGVRLDAKLVDDLKAHVAPAVKNNFKKLDHTYTYYDKTGIPSLEKFAENLHESIIFSQRLYKPTAHHYGLVLAGAVLVTLLGTFIGLSLTEDAREITIVQAFQAVIAFLATSSLYPVYGFFHQAERELDAMDGEMQRQRQGPPNRENLLMVMSDYNALMSQSRPIPTFIYKRNQAELTARVQERNANTGGTP